MDSKFELNLFCFLITIGAIAQLVSSTCVDDGNYGSKTPYQLFATDWEDVVRQAQLPSTCKLNHLRVAARHGTRSLGQDDADNCQVAIEKINSAKPNPVPASGGLTADELQQLISWTNKVPTKKDLLPRGKDEHVFLADNYHGLLASAAPNLITEKIGFESSSVDRAQESGAAFQGEWYRLSPPTTPQNITVNDTRNYFHKNCSAYQTRVDKNATAAAEFLKSGSTQEAKAIVTKVNRIKLGLTTDALAWDDLVALYTMASVEMAAFNSSVITVLFDDEDLRYFEYADDLDAFWLKSYSEDSVTRDMSCPLTTHIFETANLAYQKGADQSPIIFSFTHNEILLPVYAAFDLFHDPEQGYMADASSYFYQNRQYDTSKIGKFASNFAFLFYSCANLAAPNDKMVIMMVNGEPVALPKACPYTPACPLTTVQKSYPLATGYNSQCDFQEICWPDVKKPAGGGASAIAASTVHILTVATACLATMFRFRLMLA